jgi:hypothetical protein
VKECRSTSRPVMIPFKLTLGPPVGGGILLAVPFAAP